jgi:argininosuccinate lyase
MMHLSRFAEEIILGARGSSALSSCPTRIPPARLSCPEENPDIAELVRGKTGRVYGSLMGLLTV